MKAVKSPRRKPSPKVDLSAKYKALQSSTSTTDKPSINVPQPPLIDFNDGSQFNGHLKTFVVPPVNSNINQMTMGDRLTPNNAIDERNKPHQFNKIVHDLQARNATIRENIFFDPMTNKSPDKYYCDSGPNNNPIIMDFRASSNGTPPKDVPAAILRKMSKNNKSNSSVQGNYKQTATNKSARSNLHQTNIIDQDLQPLNARIQENMLVGSSTNSRHATPPSDNFYSDAVPNNNKNIKDFRAPSNETLTKDVPAAIQRKIAKNNTDNSSVQPIGKNESVHRNQHQTNIIDQDLRLDLVGSSTNTQHVTPPSDNFYNDAVPNNNPIIMDFRAPANGTPPKDVPAAIQRKIAKNNTDNSSVQPIGTNESARRNQHQTNIIDQDLQALNAKIQENMLVGSSTNTRHVTPPSDNFYNDAVPNNNPIIMDFRAPANGTPPKDVPAAIQRKIAKNNTDNSSVQPIGTNESARRNQHQTNIIDQDLQALKLNARIQENMLVGSSTNMRHATPPSDNFYSDAVLNNNPNIKDFRTPSNGTLKKDVPAAIHRKISQYNTDNASVQGNYKKFELPTVDHVEQVSSDTLPQILLRSPFLTQPPSNYTHQNSPPTPKNKITTQKSKTCIDLVKNQKEIIIHCRVCRKVFDNVIQLECNHVFCPQCLIHSFSSFEDAYCPFKNGNYKCSYKLEVDDIQCILETINKSMSESGTNTQISTKPKPNIFDLQPAVEKVEEDFLYFNDNDSEEVILHCKQDKCVGFWFVDQTEKHRTYECPVCGAYTK